MRKNPFENLENWSLVCSVVFTRQMVFGVFIRQLKMNNNLEKHAVCTQIYFDQFYGAFMSFPMVG